MIVYPRGVGQAPWERTFWTDTMRNAMHVGHTVDSMRLWDVICAAQALAAQDGVVPERIMTVGRGVSGILGLYAAILGAPIEQVTLIDPPSSHVEGPYFLNVLRHMDLPEAAALLAPRRLNFYARMPGAFAEIHRVYELYGKPQHLWLGMSLRAPLMNRFDHGFTSGY